MPNHLQENDLTSSLKSRLSTSDLRLMRSSPAVFLAYCGLRAAHRGLESDTDSDGGLVIFVVPHAYRPEDYRTAAEFLFLEDEAVRWTNPGRRRRVYQAPAVKPAKGVAQEISIFDLPEARFVVARDLSDIPDEVRFAAAAVIDVEPPLPLHVGAARRLLRLPPLPADVVDELCHRPQELVLAGVLRRDLSASDLQEFKKDSAVESNQPVLANLPGFDEPKAWVGKVFNDVTRWRQGTLAWSEVSKGALLVGPAGTGKTMFAQSFADACGLRLITGSFGDWEEAGYLNHTLAAMRQSFNDAIAANGAVLFIDEMDSLSRRDGLKGEYAHYRRIVINQFLALSSRPMEGVILLGATNYPEFIDPAALRAGRIEKKFVLTLPDQDERAKILAFHLGEEFEPRILTRLVADLDGYSGAQLDLLAKEARANARTLGRALTIEDVRSALPVRRKYTMEERFRLAVHEAGHALIALNLRRSRNVTITVRETYDPSMGANIGGFAKHDPMDESLWTDKSLLDRIAVSLAGMAAEEIVCQERSIGSGGGIGSDLEVATSIARLMVGSYGLGRSPVYHRRVDGSYQPPLPQLLEDEVREILTEQYQRVLAILKPERKGVMDLAKKALLNESVTIGLGDGQ